MSRKYNRLPDESQPTTFRKEQHCSNNDGCVLCQLLWCPNGPETEQVLNPILHEAHREIMNQ